MDARRDASALACATYSGDCSGATYGDGRDRSDNDGAPEYQGTTTRFENRLQVSIERYRADIIFVDGGRNDLHMSPMDLFPVMTSYIDTVRDAWPDARLVIIVPTYVTPVPYDGYDQFVSALRSYGESVVNGHEVLPVGGQ